MPKMMGSPIYIRFFWNVRPPTFGSTAVDMPRDDLNYDAHLPYLTIATLHCERETVLEDSSLQPENVILWVVYL